MIFYKSIASCINLLRYSCKGSFFLCTAIILPVILMVIGMVIDVFSWMYYRNILEQASHTTVLAALTKLSDSCGDIALDEVLIPETEEYVKRYFKRMLDHDFSSEDIDKIIRSLQIDIQKDSKCNAYNITLNPRYDMPLSLFLFFMRAAIDIKSMGVNVVVKGYTSPKSSHKETAESIQMVIDVSGSMGDPLYKDGASLNCYGKAMLLPNIPNNPDRIGIAIQKGSPYIFSEDLLSCDKSLYEVLHGKENKLGLQKNKPVREVTVSHLPYLVPAKAVILRDAIAEFIKHLQKIKNIEDKVRISSVAFSDKIESGHNMSWGLGLIIPFVASLDFIKGARTDTSVGMQKGYDNISASSEITEHNKKNNYTVRKSIILLTDGVNGSLAMDYKTFQICEKAKKEGINIFTIGFAVPQKDKKRAEKLLKTCATSPDTYFDIRDSERLNAVFKEIASAVFERAVRVTQ
ncbi:VWA domain-containing protein [Candidatus Liberibacter sp.]|uniref:vWA domain-containing protein n=1 Tax=Candidatus Liberibacter sp. TaxID=34022 RepID=UPI0015F751EF|nr:VWA domain-containing protein [Candidatus Liberibacter sp.]MBA5723821.1 VWA domain-containing protein [Candidatus Liberibacter sp.]